jgi:hypothetical protein
MYGIMKRINYSFHRPFRIHYATVLKLEQKQKIVQKDIDILYGFLYKTKLFSYNLLAERPSFIF